MTPGPAHPHQPEHAGHADPLGSGAAPRKIVMMVGNDIAHDTRVLKMGLTMADAGLDVTLLGYASSGIRQESMLGDVRILRVPVAWRLRDAAAKRRQHHREPRLHLAVDPARRRVLDLESAVRRREVTSVGGVVPTLRSNRLRADRFAARARAGLDRRAQTAEKKLWRLYDGSIHRSPVGVGWRRALPEIDDYELAFGPVLDQLDWEVLHAHDVHLVGIASRAVARRRSEGEARPGSMTPTSSSLVCRSTVGAPCGVERRISTSSPSTSGTRMPSSPSPSPWLRRCGVGTGCHAPRLWS